MNKVLKTVGIIFLIFWEVGFLVNLTTYSTSEKITSIVFMVIPLCVLFFIRIAKNKRSRLYGDVENESMGMVKKPDIEDQTAWEANENKKSGERKDRFMAFGKKVNKPNMEGTDSSYPEISPEQLILKYKDNKIDAIKHVNQITGLGIKESKKIVDKVYKDHYDAIMNRQALEISSWSPTKVVDRYFQVDDINKKWATMIGVFKPKAYQIYNYDDILEYELMEDGDTIIKGGLGRAAAGGVLFGGVGAVVGGITGKRTAKKIVNSMSIKVTLRTMSEPTTYIKFITTKTKTSSFLYKNAANCAQETLSILAQIVEQNEQAQNVHSTEDKEILSAADEIRKYKELMDDGIISQEEFEAKKKELLG